LKSSITLNTTLFNILNALEVTNKAISERGLAFLKREGLYELYAYTRKEYCFSEYLNLAKLAQKNRHTLAERKSISEVIIKTKRPTLKFNR